MPKLFIQGVHISLNGWQSDHSVTFHTREWFICFPVIDANEYHWPISQAAFTVLII